MEIHFTVPGEPQGKGRPIASTVTGNVKMRTPEDTVSYENSIAMEYKRQCKYRFEDKEALHMSVTAIYTIPKRISKTKRKQMADDIIRPTKKPDVDNVLKVIADSLNGIAYRDDAQIVSVLLNKFYGEKPGLIIVISCATLPF